MNTFVLVLSGVPFLVVGSALLLGGWTKARDLRAARTSLHDYRIVPRSLVGGAARVVAAVELCVGLACIALLPLGGAIAVLLLAGFSVAIASALMRGLTVDCHCGVEGERIGPQMLARNAILSASLIPGILLPLTSPLSDASATALPVAVAQAFTIASALALLSIARLRASESRHVDD